MVRDHLYCSKCGEPYPCDSTRQFVFCAVCGNKNPCSPPDILRGKSPSASFFDSVKSKLFLWANIIYSAGWAVMLIIPIFVTDIVIKIISLLSAVTPWLSFIATALGFLKNIFAGIGWAVKIIGYAEDVVNVGSFSTNYGPVIVLALVWLPVLVKAAALTSSWMLYYFGKKQNMRMAAVSVKVFVISTVISFIGKIALPLILLLSSLFNITLLLPLSVIPLLYCAILSYLYITIISGLLKISRIINGGDVRSYSLRGFAVAVFIGGILSALSLQLFDAAYYFMIYSILEKYNGFVNRLNEVR